MRRGLAYSFSEGIADIVRNTLVNLLSILTIAVSITVLGVFILLAINLNAFSSQRQDAFLLHIFLDDQVTAPEEADHLLKRLNEDERVIGFAFVSREAAMARFAEMFPEEADVADELNDFTLPASFDVEINQSLVGDERTLDSLVQEYAQLELVDEVLYDNQWQESLESLTRWVTGFGLFLGGLLIFAAIVTTSNIIKLNYLSRKEEIEIMRLVGADGIYVKGPFIVSGVIQGLLASLLALALLLGLFYSAAALLQSADILIFEDFSLLFLPLWLIVAIAAGGPVAGLLASLLTLTTVNRV